MAGLLSRDRLTALAGLLPTSNSPPPLALAFSTEQQYLTALDSPACATQVCVLALTDSLVPHSLTVLCPTAAADSEYCGGEHSLYWGYCGPGVPPDRRPDALAQPHHGLSGFPGSGNRVSHRSHAGPAALLSSQLTAHAHSKTAHSWPRHTHSKLR